MIRESAQNSEDIQFRIELRLPDHVNGLSQLNQSGKRKESSRYRNQKFIAGYESIDRQYSEGGGVSMMM